MTAPIDIIICAEAESDAKCARVLIDRVLLDTVTWLSDQPELLDNQRSWRGFDAHSSFIDIHKIRELADQYGIPRPHGHFDGRTPAPDYRSAVRMMWLLNGIDPPPVLVWVRDTDGDQSRSKGWQDACHKAGSRFKLLLAGFPHECMEAWLLASWSPKSSSAEANLAAQRRRLGFDPTREPEHLSHKTNVPKSAKRVCGALAIDGESLEETDLGGLHEHTGCGVAAFVDDVRQRLASAIK